jgi:hypothetical protein
LPNCLAFTFGDEINAKTKSRMIEIVVITFIV